jgi:hypothetical protein
MQTAVLNQVTVQAARRETAATCRTAPTLFRASVRMDLLLGGSGVMNVTPRQRMRPSFLRFPGGNYVEGNNIESHYDWRKTIGPLVDRPTHPSTWSYHSTDGLGLLEFLEWCEDLNMEPLLAVFAGYTLDKHVVKPGPDLEPYVQEALDEIEYVTGASDTKWGALRQRDGHPAPFKLRYVEIGNEDSFDRAKTYDGRFAQFYKAIKAKYPDLQVIATMPVIGVTPDIVDDHYYKREQGMFEESKHYDRLTAPTTVTLPRSWTLEKPSRWKLICCFDGSITVLGMTNAIVPPSFKNSC